MNTTERFVYSLVGGPDEHLRQREPTIQRRAT